MSAALQGEHQQFSDMDYSSSDPAPRYMRTGVRRGSGPRPVMLPVRIFHAAPSWMYAFLFRLLSLVSLVLERTLSQLHSLVHQTARIAKPAAADADHATASKQQKQRAWWNVRKGSAIVLWSSPSCMSSVAGELSTWDLVHRLALALASIEKRAEGAGRAPYTVIVVVPSAQRGLTPLISDWAKTKADIEMMRKGNTSPPTAAASSARSKSGWFLRFLSEADDASPERSSESPLSAVVDVEPPAEEKGRPRRASAASSSNASSSSSTGGSKTPKKQRRSSGGRWTASDVVGLGMDMLKGLRVGQDLFDDANFGSGGIGGRGDTRQDQRTTSRIGAVIPVVADTSTAAGLAHARSTIQAYCTSHDLLLRGLVVVPFVMGPPSQSIAVALGDEAAAAADAATDASAGTSPSTSNLPTPKFGSNWSSQLASGLSPMTKTRTTASLSRASVRRTKQALDSDVVETLNMISALLPALVSDGGRVIGIMPTRWNVVPDESLEGVSGQSGTRGDDEVLDAGMAYQVAHNALTAMWQSISVELTAMGLRSCQVHMAPIRRRRRRSDVHSELKHGEGLTGHFVRWLAKRFATTCFALLHPTLVEADATAFPLADAKEDSFDKTRKRTQKGTFSTLFSTQPLDSSTCPPLLIDAVRSSLVRSCPREKYCVGLGPRMQEAILYLTPPVFRNLASRVVLNRFLTS